MKLTIKELGAAYAKGKQMFQKVTLESEPVVTVSGNNYFSMSQRTIVKTLEAPVIAGLFGANAAVGSELNGWAIRQRHTFVPDQSIAVETAKGVTKPQLYNFSRNTGKMYLADGKVFYNKYELVRDGEAAIDDVFDNITSCPVIPALTEGRRPDATELAAWGQQIGVAISVDESTVAKLNAPLAAPAVAATRRAEAAGALPTV